MPISIFLTILGKISSHRAVANEGDGPTEDERRRIEALYLGEVTFVDKWVGVLLDKIEQLNIKDETLVVLMSDHGTQLRDPRELWERRRTNYTRSIRS